MTARVGRQHDRLGSSRLWCSFGEAGGDLMPAPHVELYEDAATGWRWRRVAGNGEVTGQGESYTRKSDAREAATREYPGLSIFVIEVTEKPYVPPEPVPPPEDDAA